MTDKQNNEMKTDMNETNETQRSEFLAEFARTTGLNSIEADEQWAGFSRSLPYAEIDEIMAGGAASGREEGEKWNAAYK